jgi:hypothetical protein
MKKYLLTFFSIFLTISSALSQQVLPVLTEIKYQVISDTLKITNKPQIITLVITNESGEKLNALQVRFAKLDMYWTLIRGSLNKKNLWLIQSDISPAQKNVLAWEYNEANKQLILYQENFSTPFRLELEIQLNLVEYSLNQKEFDDNIIVEAITPSGVYNCYSGDGSNKIHFK